MCRPSSASSFDGRCHASMTSHWSDSESRAKSGPKESLGGPAPSMAAFFFGNRARSRSLLMRWRRYSVRGRPSTPSTGSTNRSPAKTRSARGQSPSRMTCRQPVPTTAMSTMARRTSSWMRLT